MKTQPKQIRWLGDSLDEVKTFSDEAKHSAGHQLGLVQLGIDPLDWKPMETVGAGVKEFASGWILPTVCCTWPSSAKRSMSCMLS